MEFYQGIFTIAFVAILIAIVIAYHKRKKEKKSITNSTVQKGTVAKSTVQKSLAAKHSDLRAMFPFGVIDCINREQVLRLDFSQENRGQLWKEMPHPFF